MQRAIDTKVELQEQLQLAQNSKLSAEERAQILEEALKKEERHITEVERELSRLREFQVKKNSRITENNCNVSNIRFLLRH